MTLLATDFLPAASETFQSLRYMMQKVPGMIPHVKDVDYLVTQRGAGANMSVDVAAGSAWVAGGSVARQGIYHQINDATLNQAVGAAHATLPRIDQVVLTISDASISGASNTPAVVVVAGTATAAADLSNRNGAVSNATLDSTYHNWIRLADVLVPAASSSVVSTNIRDRRPKLSGKAVISATESTSSTSYTYLTTADVVRELVVPADSLIIVSYQATWQESVVNAARAAIFVGTNQLQAFSSGTAPTAVATEAILNSAFGAAIDYPMSSVPWGLNCGTNGGSSSYTGDVATGQAVASRQYVASNMAGGSCEIFGLPAGNYDVGVMYKASSGSVTVKNRRLYVRVEDMAGARF